MNFSDYYELRHLSLRVPWHDNVWNGTICNKPHFNNSCLVLKRIADERYDEREVDNANKSIDDLDEKIWPLCKAERGFFMAPFDYNLTVVHPYKWTSKKHKHFKASYFYNAAFSASAVPFRWLLKDNMGSYSDEYNLDCHDELEPDIGFHSAWVQSIHNQENLLNGFFEHLEIDKSLCFFYAKNVPFVEERGRILIGIGKIKRIGDSQEHQYTRNLNKNDIRSMIWERNVVHSIREDFEDGFLFPYQEIVEFCEKNPDADPSEFAVIIPDSHRLEFSYASEHVKNDGAIEVLQKTLQSLSKIKDIIPGPWEKCEKWIDEQLGNLWSMRGPYPGLGSVLRAFGIDLGNIIANYIKENVGGIDQWDMIDKIFEDPKSNLPPDLSIQIHKIDQKKWKKIPDERKNFLKLLSRFEITIDQAKLFYHIDKRKNAHINCEDNEVIENPYLLYELSRYNEHAIDLWVIDRGLYPDVSIIKEYPISEPSAMDGKHDERRIRAILVYLLDKASSEGHTLLPIFTVLSQMNELPLDPPLEIDQETLEVLEEDFEDEIILLETQNGERAYQIKYLNQMGNIISETVNSRRENDLIEVDEDWDSILNEIFDKDEKLMQNVDKKLEKEARREKTAALKILAESSFSLLVGPAGTGKTKLLSVLCSQKDIYNEGILLLAPTGKARVKLEEGMQKIGLKAQTIAQYLIKLDRYDWKTGRYHLSDQKKSMTARTVIIDEASMISEDMLSALFDSFSGVKRLILVGDSYQLPPIGPGRPFVDIKSQINPDVTKKFPKIDSNYAELTINIRHIDLNKDGKDLEIARWFSGDDVEISDEETSSIINVNGYSNCICFKKWETSEEFQKLILETIVSENYQIQRIGDWEGFNKSFGAIKNKNFEYYPEGIDNWQILSPVRNQVHGVSEINHLIHKNFRGGLIHTHRKEKYLLKPLGIEEIVNGDKVINISNHPRPRSPIENVYEKTDGYIANGEIGVVKSSNPKFGLNVCFTTQKDFLYGFHKSLFGEESNTLLELAYALTVHKAQGSDFDKVFLVIPKKSPLISKELVYTALTRHKTFITVLYEGDPNEIIKYSSVYHSETAKRFTNLFKNPDITDVGNKFFEKSLIHKTINGEMVRSKSEVIVANLLKENDIEYEYEKKLQFKREYRYPDFTIVSNDGQNVYYWEHLGMLNKGSYREDWERKKKWYIKHDILPLEDGGGKNGTLVVSKDDLKGGISSKEIEDTIKKLKIE